MTARSFCGTFNSLRSGEVFTLLPGDSKPLGGWIQIDRLPMAGEYHLRLLLENDPARRWLPDQPGYHDPAEMVKVRNSTPCLMSEDVVIKVE